MFVYLFYYICHFLVGIGSKNYRSKTEVVAAILTATKEKPLGKTRLMYTAYVSSLQLREYLAELQNKGLLSYDEVTRTFITTTHGGEYLKLYEAMDNLGTKE